MEAKVFNDPVHGQIKIPELCIRIIDTPQFQRLRRIQQLGGVSYVYYGATHTRFEHSIGVCHLAGALLEHLRKEQDYLKIDEKDILCVQVAGLCHDLGHGPFSHVWEKNILNKHSKLKHEDLSVDMFKHLVDKNKLRPEFKKHLKLSEDQEVDDELNFIQELIKGEKNPNGAWSMNGRKEQKAFLYDIISNKTNGIDVDKWDYFARDCYYLGIENSFDHLRLMNFARVLSVNERRQVEICRISYRDKEVSDVYELFHTRYRLHQKAYQHKTVKAVERMLSDVILMVRKLTFQGQNGKKKTLMDVMKDRDMTAYESLDDTVISRIKQMDPKSYSKEVKQMDPNSNSEEDEEALKNAKTLIERLEKREIYRCFPSAPIDAEKVEDLIKRNANFLKQLSANFLEHVEEFRLKEEDFNFEDLTMDKKAKLKVKFLKNVNFLKHVEELRIKEEDADFDDLTMDKIAELKVKFVKHVKFLKRVEELGIKEEDVEFDTVTYDYGMKTKNPVANVYFYEKSNPDIFINIPKDKVSMMLPKTFSESRLIMLVKKQLDGREEIGYFKRNFEDFCETHSALCSEEQAGPPAQEPEVVYQRR